MANLKPHKAEDANLNLIRFPVMCMPKIDGVRGIRLSRYLTGRTLKQFRNSNVTSVFSAPEMFGLDGELTVGNICKEGLCARTTGVLNSYHWNTAGEIPFWYIFDYVTPQSYFLPYRTRYKMAEILVKQLYHDYIKLVPEPLVCGTVDEVLEYHSCMVALGYEGTILRYLEAPHKNGRCTQREAYYLRIKDFASAEGIVTSLIEGQTNLNEKETDLLGYSTRSSHQVNQVPSGKIGSMVVNFPAGTIRAKPELTSAVISAGAMTWDKRQEYYENPHLIMGKTVTFTYMPYGMKDNLRFAQFKDFRLEEDL